MKVESVRIDELLEWSVLVKCKFDLPVQGSVQAVLSRRSCILVMWFYFLLGVVDVPDLGLVQSCAQQMFLCLMIRSFS